MNRREKQKQEKLQRIETVARRLFSHKGYDNTTTREIAEEANVATGTLFVYFPEKKDLLIHLFHRDVMPVIEQSWSTLPQEGGLIVQIVHVFGRIYDCYARDLRLATVFAKELSFLEGKQRDHMGSYSAGFVVQLAMLVKRAQLAGEVAPRVEAGQAAVALFGIYHLGLVLWVTGTLTRGQLEQQNAKSLALLMQGFSPR